MLLKKTHLSKAKNGGMILIPHAHSRSTVRKLKGNGFSRYLAEKSVDSHIVRGKGTEEPLLKSGTGLQSLSKKLENVSITKGNKKHIRFSI